MSDESATELEGVKAKTRTVEQGVFLPLTFLPKHYAGKTVRIVITTETVDEPDDDDLFPHTPPNQELGE